MSKFVFPKRLFRATSKRIGTALGSAVAAFLVLSPEQAAQIEAAAVVLVGLAADFFFDREF